MFVPQSGVRRLELADWSGKLHHATPVSPFLLVVLSFFLACYMNDVDAVTKEPRTKDLAT